MRFVTARRIATVRRVVNGRRVVTAAGTFAAMLSAHTALNARLLRRPLAAPPSVGDAVTVCVPARNEEHNIVDCVRAIQKATGVDDLAILVLDDGSTDRTAELVETIAAADPRVKLVRGSGSVPFGWIGKTNASQQLFNRVTSPFVVFVDADVRLQPHAIAASIELLERQGFDLISPYPQQIAITPVERVVQPLLQWLWLTFLPLRLAERTSPASMVAANGQFMVARTSALQDIGGFAEVRGEVLDDVALGRALKSNGKRVTVVDGTSLATCRMYTSWSELRDGYTKNLWSATGSKSGGVAMSAMLSFAYLVPPIGTVIGVLSRRPAISRAGLAGYLAGVLGRIISARTTGGSTKDAVAHPFSVAALIGLIGRSWRAHDGGEIMWKGRQL